MTLRDQIVDQIIAEMERQDVSRAELGRRMGVSRQRISQILGGCDNVCIDTLARLGKAIGCEWQFIISGKDDN